MRDASQSDTAPKLVKEKTWLITGTWNASPRAPAGVVEFRSPMLPTSLLAETAKKLATAQFNASAKTGNDTEFQIVQQDLIDDKWQSDHRPHHTFLKLLNTVTSLETKRPKQLRVLKTYKQSRN